MGEGEEVVVNAGRWFGGGNRPVEGATVFMKQPVAAAAPAVEAEGDEPASDDEVPS